MGDVSPAAEMKTIASFLSPGTIRALPILETMRILNIIILLSRIIYFEAYLALTSDIDF